MSKSIDPLALSKDKKIPVVLEIGTAYTKCGFAGESSPRHVIPTEVRPCHSNKITRIFDGGKTWQDDTEGLYDLLIDFLHHIYFRRLLVNPRDRRVVIVESLFSPSHFRKTLAKVLFQHYNVPSIMFLPSSMSVLVSLGIATGLVIDCGYEETSLLPIVEGVPIMKCWQSLPCGGHAVQVEVKRLLFEYGTISDGETSKPLPACKAVLAAFLTDNVLEDIAARVCFVGKRLVSQQQLPVADDLRQQISTSAMPLLPTPPSVSYPLDGSVNLIIPGIVREQAADVIFKHDNETRALPTTILDIILKCPIDTRRSLMENIVVVGGTAMLPGFHDRLMRELKDIAASGKYVSCLPSSSFKFHTTYVPANCTSWMGGSIHGSVDILNERSVSRDRFLQTNQLPDWTSCDPSSRTVSTAERSANVMSGLRKLSLPSPTQKVKRRSGSMMSLFPRTGETSGVSPVSSISEIPVKQTSPK